jgi:hypothetical protein
VTEIAARIPPRGLANGAGLRLSIRGPVNYYL